MIARLTALRDASRRCLSTLVLAVIWFGLLTPVALLMRLLGRDVLRLKRDPGATTYWRERPPPGSLERPF